MFAHEIVLRIKDKNNIGISNSFQISKSVQECATVSACCSIRLLVHLLIYLSADTFINESVIIFEQN